MVGPFMYVFFILPVEVGYGVISSFSDKKIGVQLFVTKQNYARLKVKGKGNGHPRADHEGPEG
jgi:hypothetical protein